MAGQNIIQLFPGQTTAANANTTAAVAELATKAAATTAASLSGAAAEGGALASVWAPVSLLCASVDQQATHVAAVVALRGQNISRSNDKALAEILEGDEYNRRDLTTSPVLSV
uniref:Uncharacterized protein n=1 Tax=Mycobacterium riyadhense TaxID=486698 RepID=A0A653EXU9_9MYCO|nr:hypothetical protein BIN_B_04461 [Mycobacterium riyadhense]